MSSTVRVWRYWIIRSKALFLICQVSLLSAVLFLAVWTQFAHSGTPFGTGPAWVGLILWLLSTQICCYCKNLYSSIATPYFGAFLDKAFSSLLLGLLIPLPLFLSFPYLYPGHIGALAAIGLSGALVFGSRPLLQCMIRHKRFVEWLLVLGTGDQARKFYRELSCGDKSDANFSLATSELAAEADDYPEPFEEYGEVVIPGKLAEIMLRDRISRIVVAEPDAQSSEDIAVALLDCKLRGLQVEQAIESYEKLNNKIWLEALRPEWLIYSEGFTSSKSYLAFKRCFDFVAALLLLVLSAPILALIAILIRITSGSPILLRQDRVGLHGKRFVLMKFRTMRPDAEKATGPVWAAATDDRVTPLGKYLRKFRLDELPQLFNVLQGNMSLIGPRPERPYFVEMLTKHIHYYGLRHSVKPGITGWAQVLYPYGASIRDAYEKLQYDLYYAKHMSVRLDLKILLGTCRVVLFGRGR